MNPFANNLKDKGIAMNYSYLVYCIPVLISFYSQGMKLASSTIIDAAKKGNITLMRELIQGGARIDEKDREFRATALHWAVGENDEKLLRFLVEETSIDVNATNKFGSTALVFAACEEKYHLMRILLKHAKIDVNIQSGDGATALHYLMIHVRDFSYEKKEIIELLLNKGAKPHLPSASGTALDLARKTENQALIQLLEKLADLDQMIICAIRANAGIERIKALLKSGARVDENSAWDGFLYAVKNGRSDIVQELIKAGARVAQPLICDGRNDVIKEFPHDIADENGHKELAAVLKLYFDMPSRVLAQDTVKVEEFIRNGHYVNARYDVYTESLLHAAARAGHTNIIELLLQAGADINKQDYLKRTPIYCAALEGKREAMLCLLKHKANVKIALESAIAHKDEKVFARLMEAIGEFVNQASL